MFQRDDVNVLNANVCEKRSTDHRITLADPDAAAAHKDAFFRMQAMFKTLMVPETHVFKVTSS
jgi:hypothetical protein